MRCNTAGGGFAAFTFAFFHQSTGDAIALRDEEEEDLGTDPTNPDTDGDGLTDGLEVDTDTDPTNASDDVPAAELSFQGGAPGGCTAAPDTSGGWAGTLMSGVVLALWWVRRRRRATLVAAAAVTGLAAQVGGTQTAHAQDRFSVHGLEPAAARETSYIQGRQATIGYRNAWNVNLFTSYANDPLVLRNEEGERVRGGVEHQVVTDFLASFAPTSWLDFSVAVPFFQYQSGTNVAEVGLTQDVNPRAGFGDVRLAVRGIALEPEAGSGGAALGFFGQLSLPTGRQELFQGSEFHGDIGVLFDWVFSQGTRVGLNAAYRIGGQTELENVVQNDVFSVTAASAVQLTPSGDWFLVPEVSADIAIGADGIEDVNSPVEGLMAVRFLGVDHLVAELGGGMGLVPGVGSADYRLFLSLGGRSMPAPVVEEVIIIDPCADTPEDMDGSEDEDGCLDPDNDQDGILDVNDGADAACANEPEDMDGNADTDGCTEDDRVVVTCEQLEISESVLFETNSDVIDTRSTCPAVTADGRARHRRVVFVIVEQDACEE